MKWKLGTTGTEQAGSAHFGLTGNSLVHGGWCGAHARTEVHNFVKAAI